MSVLPFKSKLIEASHRIDSASPNARPDEIAFRPQADSEYPVLLVFRSPGRSADYFYSMTAETFHDFVRTALAVETELNEAGATQ